MATQSERIAQLQRMTRRPSTPGDLLADLIERNGLTQATTAQHLGVGRKTVNELIGGKRGLTLDMAHRLGRFFGNGPTLWLNLKQQAEHWDALHMDTAPYNEIVELPREKVAA